ncbi:thioredoxin [Lacrimispora sp. NSJ-141]|uniref:Thioredoxin n=1 Tax=Lientehia hominis TaxID=2897778 RepID=A0AAP2W7U7_9FIRM|nr:thioredoxin [Lientehia hominis]MCD2491366.1 thioredoxin [Lientehia hominis]
MSVKTITKQNFHREIMNSTKPVLLDFWAEWCGPCRMLSPTVDALAGERPDITIGKVNIDEQADLAKQFRIMSIPTLVVLKDGKVTAQKAGVQSKENIRAMLYS